MLNFSNGSPELDGYLRWWHAQRHRARTDLLWLCNEVLGYRDVSERVHGPILKALQKFPGAVEQHKSVEDIIAAQQGKVLWEPRVKMELLPPNEGFLQSRDTQYLYPRGHLKSTVITVAHTIQWQLNYPNVRILISTATETLVTGFIQEIRGHLTGNEALRHLFPEICPIAKDGKIPELGNLGGYTLPCRDNTNKALGPGGKEPTVLASTVGSAITGYHGDVQKNDDLVEKINSSSQNGIDDVIRHFGSLGDLLEKYNTTDPERPLKGWVDTVGTPWDFSDLYQVRKNQQEELRIKGRPETVNMVIESAAPNWPLGPFLWPERMGYTALKEIEDDPTKGPAQLSAQYLMNPIVAGQGLIDDVKDIEWTPRRVFDELRPRMTLYAALDLHGMDPNSKGSDNDYSCLTVGGFMNGRLYIEAMWHGRPTPEEVIEWLFECWAEYPQLVKFKIEKEAHARVLLAFLRAEQAKRGIWLPIEDTPRSNQQSKKDKIRGLRPWFTKKRLRFADDLGYRVQIQNEVKGFPKFRHDDILDTITDLMHEGKGVNAGVMGNEKEFTRPERPQTPLDGMLAEMDRRNGWREEARYDMETGWLA
jgi:hypothetical protein